MTLKLIIGNKNYSSWSMRPWLAMKAAGIEFSEEVISLNAPDFKERLLKFSGTGKVPTLIDGDIHIWESMAILEYLAEKFPAAQLWPTDPKARAHARAISNEMHAGFVPLRRACPMNLWRPVKKMTLSDDVAANVRRIDAMWSDCRVRFGAGGAFLFGKFCNADAMYAPVVSRFHTYAIEVSATSRDYVNAILALPAYVEWKAAGVKEPWILPQDEPDWPTVLKE
ncbi:MAG: glutathione S-transferase family protein [Xanthobacteraceae bacterium]